MSALERETTVTTSDGEDEVQIWTYQRRYITRLLKHPKVTVRDYDPAVPMLYCTVPSKEWNPVSGIKRTVNMSDERKAELTARLHKLREARG